MVGICLCLYFSVHIVAGGRSYSHLSDLIVISKQKMEYLDKLQQEKSDIEAKVSMMRPGSLSVDMLEEQASVILGYNFASDIVVISN